MATESSELTGDLLLNQQQSKEDDDDDDVNVNGHNNHREDDVIFVSQDITTTTATNTEECENRVKEQNTKATEEAVFINHGLVRWEKSRRGWLAASSSPPPSTTVSSSLSDSISGISTGTVSKQPKQSSAAAIPLDVDEIIDLIFSQRWRSTDDERAQFPQPVPLPQMVDILVDLWEAEGLDI